MVRMEMKMICVMADDDDEEEDVDDAVDDEPGVEWWFGWAGKPAEEN